MATPVGVASLASMPTSHASPSSAHGPTTAPPAPTTLKKFTHAQIESKIASRRARVPEYESLLHACEVRRESDGVVFDSSHSSWQMLLHLCQVADKLDRESQAKTGKKSDIVVTSKDFPLTPMDIDRIEGQKAQMAGGAHVQHQHRHQQQPQQAQHKQTSALGEKAGATRHHMQATSHPPPTQQSIDDDGGWVDVNVRSGRGVGSVIDPSSMGGAGNGHAFPVSAMSRAANAFNKFSEFISTRPQTAHATNALVPPPHAHHPNQHQTHEHAQHRPQQHTQTQTQHPHPPLSLSHSSTHRKQGSGGSSTGASQSISVGSNSKSSSNSSRDVRQVQEDLDFEAAILSEYTNANAQAKAAAADSTSTTTAAASTPDKGVTSSSEKDALLREFLALLHPNVAVDVGAIKGICKTLGVPVRHRGALWCKMLGVRLDEKDESAMEAEDERINNQGQGQGQTQVQGQGHQGQQQGKYPSRARLMSFTEAEQEDQLSIEDENREASSTASAASAAASVSASASPSVPLPLPSSVSIGAPPSRQTCTPTKFDLFNQRVIRADIERTLPHLKTFQSTQVRHDMELILTHYCKRHNVNYKQGQNYILAPLFLLNLPDRDAIYRLYEALIARLLPTTFSDNEFGSLQCVFLLFKMCLQYHDPELYTYLIEENDLGPELFASSWFIALHANKCKLNVLFYLWDCLILDCIHDENLNFWVSLALLVHHRSMLLRESVVHLPETLSKLSISSKKEASVLVNRAKKIFRSHSSLTCRLQLKRVTSTKVGMDSVEYAQLSQQFVLQVSEEELVRSCYGDVNIPTLTNNTQSDTATNAKSHSDASLTNPESATINDASTGHKQDAATEPPSSSTAAAPSLSLTVAGSPPLKFFILDCRPLEQYESGHLPCAYHLDPSFLHDPSALIQRVEGLQGMNGSCHWCFLGEGGERPHVAAVNGSVTPTHISSTAVVKAFVQVFIRKGFKYLSHCPGGYAACHALILASTSGSSMELVDHHPDTCLECNGRRKVKEKKGKGFLSNVRRFAGTVMARLDSGGTEDATRSSLPPSAVVLLGGENGSIPSIPSPNSLSTTPTQLQIQLHLLHTVIRDKSVDVSSFADALHRLTAILLGSFFERVEVSERNVSSGAGSMFTGVAAAPVTTITCNDHALEMLDSAFHPFRTVCPRSNATYVFEKAPTKPMEKDGPGAGAGAGAVNKPSSNAEPSERSAHPPLLLSRVVVPPNLLETNVLLFFPVLTPAHWPQLYDILIDLISTREVACSQITVSSIILARNVMMQLATEWPDILIITTAMDEVGQKNRLMPGIHQWDERYAMAK